MDLQDDGGARDLGGPLLDGEALGRRHALGQGLERGERGHDIDRAARGLEGAVEALRQIRVRDAPEDVEVRIELHAGGLRREARPHALEGLAAERRHLVHHGPVLERDADGHVEGPDRPVGGRGDDLQVEGPAAVLGRHGVAGLDAHAGQAGALEEGAEVRRDVLIARLREGREPVLPAHDLAHVRLRERGHRVEEHLVANLVSEHVEEHRALAVADVVVLVLGLGDELAQRVVALALHA